MAQSMMVLAIVVIAIFALVEMRFRSGRKFMKTQKTEDIKNGKIHFLNLSVLEQGVTPEEYKGIPYIVYINEMDDGRVHINTFFSEWMNNEWEGLASFDRSLFVKQDGYEAMKKEDIYKQAYYCWMSGKSLELENK